MPYMPKGLHSFNFLRACLMRFQIEAHFFLNQVIKLFSPFCFKAIDMFTCASAAQPLFET